MSWYDYLPGVANVADAFRGDWKGAINPLDAQFNIGGAVKDAYNAPFDQKRAGYDAVIDQSQKLKAERMARKDKTYAQAEEQYRPAREALAAVYGDPRSWKL